MAELVLIRGLPGSGKTTKALTEYPNHVLCEADQFFETDDGYKYDGSKIKDAHEYCFSKARKALMVGLDVVVANTFTRVWEMQKYLDLPYEVHVVEATGDYENVHNVPQEVVAKMRDRYEPYSF